MYCSGELCDGHGGWIEFLPFSYFLYFHTRIIFAVIFIIFTIPLEIFIGQASRSLIIKTKSRLFKKKKSSKIEFLLKSVHHVK